jgi:hypothetical protein
MISFIAQPNTIGELELAIESVALKRLLIDKANGKLLLCGQCCVAMVAETTLQEAIIACGQVGATMPADLMRALRIFQVSHKWRRYYVKRVPDQCLIHLTAERTSHWIHRYYDFVYNPAAKAPSLIKDFDLQNASSLIEIT